MKLKDYIPKYTVLELMEWDDNRSLWENIQTGQLIPFHDAIAKYGDQEIESVKDFDDTRTTSIIIAKRRES